MQLLLLVTTSFPPAGSGQLGDDSSKGHSLLKKWGHILRDAHACILPDWGGTGYMHTCTNTHKQGGGRM